MLELAALGLYVTSSIILGIVLVPVRVLEGNKWHQKLDHLGRFCSLEMYVHCLRGKKRKTHNRILLYDDNGKLLPSLLLNGQGGRSSYLTEERKWL